MPAWMTLNLWKYFNHEIQTDILISCSRSLNERLQRTGKI